MSGPIDPQWYRWNGAMLVPQRKDLAEHQFQIDGVYLLEVHHERSYARHRAYFASLNEAWQSLDHQVFPSAEHLRKFALIKTGWRNERRLVCRSHREAERIALWCRPSDTFAIYFADGTTLVEWTAVSQNYRSMKGYTFNRSMDEVLDYVAGLVGVAAATLARQGESA